MHIGAVVEDDVMRVKQFFAYRLIGTVPNKGFYHSSKYAALTDAEWEEMKKTVYEDKELQATVAKEQAEYVKTISEQIS